MVVGLLPYRSHHTEAPTVMGRCREHHICILYVYTCYYTDTYEIQLPMNYEMSKRYNYFF